MFVFVFIFIFIFSLFFFNFRFSSRSSRFPPGGGFGARRGGEGVVLVSVRLVGGEDQPHPHSRHELQDIRRQDEQQARTIHTINTVVYMFWVKT